MAFKDPLLGRTLNERYLIKKRIGKGGFGVVYLVEHLKLGKKLAMKALFRSSQLNSKLVGRFEREAKATSRIGHPNIVDVVDYGEDEQAGYYFIMEYLEGRSLQAEIKDGAMKPIRAVRIAQQIASALLATHQNGIIHRDLKPDNVMLMSHVGSHQDFVKVLDFGVAGLAGQSEEEEEAEGGKLTAHGMVFGTPHYMSPEQALSPDVDQRSDIYAFGVLLYEMVTGQVPFDAPSTMELLTKHRDDVPERPSAVHPDALIPAGLEQVIMKCLAKAPERRWQSASEILERLEAVESSILRGVPIVLARDAELDSSLFMVPGKITAPEPVFLPPPRKKSPLPLAIGAGLLGALVVGLLMFKPWVTKDAPPETADAQPTPEAVQPVPEPVTPEPEPVSPEPVAPEPTPAEPAPVEVEPTEVEPATPTPPEPVPEAVEPAPVEPPPVEPPPGEPATPTEWELKIVSQPAGAAVEDEATGERIGTTPFTLALKTGAGTRLVVLKRRGYKPLKASLDADALASAETRQQVFKLDRKKKKGPAKPDSPFGDF